MIHTPTPARIFLADGRQLLQTALHRSFATISVEARDQPETGQQVLLSQFSDEELAASAVTACKVPAPGCLAVLPITGDVTVHHSGQEIRVSVDEFRLIDFPGPDRVRFSNPYSSGTINYLLFFLQAAPAPELAGSFSFDLENNRNELLQLCASPGLFAISIGRFSGRKSGIHRLGTQNRQLFAFVIDGAFEAENRLLQPRDGLRLSHLSDFEFESLSEGAILLVLELY